MEEKDDILIEEEADNPAQMAVIMPISGVAPAATASDIDKGIETKETVMPDFQLFFKLTAKELNNFFIKNKTQK